MTEEYETGGKLSRNIQGQYLIRGGNCRFAMRNNDTDDAQLADGLVTQRWLSASSALVASAINRMPGLR